MKRLWLKTFTVLFSGAIVSNNAVADSKISADNSELKRIQSAIEDEENKIKKLKALQANFEYGLVEEDQVGDMITMINAGKNPAKLTFYYAPVTQKAAGVYSEDATYVMLPQGYRLVKDPLSSASYDKCMENTTNRYEMGLCDDGVLKMVDKKLNDDFTGLKYTCKSIGNGCDKALLEAQRAWIKYRESTYKFMESYIGIYEASSRPQRIFWINELVKQEALLEEIDNLLKEVHNQYFSYHTVLR